MVKLNHITHKIVLFIAQASILAMVAIVTLTVILRYCFNTGLSWAEGSAAPAGDGVRLIACAIGVRDHMHVAVNAIYNKFPVGGKVRKALDVLTDVVVLLCGMFMLYSGGARTIKLFGLPGVLPITGISTAWQYLPIPVAGFVMSFDSILFLTGIISRDDLLYSEPEVDFTDEAAVAAMTKEAERNDDRDVGRSGFDRRIVLLLLMRVPISFAMLLATLGSALVTGNELLRSRSADGGRREQLSLLSIPFFHRDGRIYERGRHFRKDCRSGESGGRRFRGGLAYVNVLDSMFFGGISGSAVADVPRWARSSSR